MAIAVAGLAFTAHGGGGVAALADTATESPTLTGCSPQQVKDRVDEFARAIRDADLDALDAVWGDRFKWFSTGFRGRDGKVDGFVARSPSAALGYIEKRDGLPMRIHKVGFNGKYRGAADFEYEGNWGSNRKLQGKGNMICRSPQIRVWSMAVRRR